MRIPLVSRFAFEQLHAAYANEVGYLRGELLKEQQRSEHLLDTVLSLKVSGATSIIAAAGAIRTPVRERSAIDQAIDENAKASSNPALRNHLSRWASKKLGQRPADVDEEEWIEDICDEIRRWSVVGEDRDDDDDERIA